MFDIPRVPELMDMFSMSAGTLKGTLSDRGLEFPCMCYVLSSTSSIMWSLNITRDSPASSIVSILDLNTEPG